MVTGTKLEKPGPVLTGLKSELISELAEHDVHDPIVVPSASKRRKTEGRGITARPQFRFPKTQGSDPHISLRITGETSKLIYETLSPAQRKLFKDKCFRLFLDVNIPNGSGTLAHAIITREVIRQDAKPNELWYNIGGVDLKYSEWEFGLMTGLRFGNLKKALQKVAALKNKDRLRQKYLSEFDSPENNDLKTVLAERDWSREDDNDAVSFAMVFFVCLVLLDNTHDRKIRDWILKLADYPEKFNGFRWGVLAWEENYKTLKAAMTGGTRKIMAEQYNAGTRQKRVPYQLCGFPVAFQAWILEIWPEARTHFTKIKGVLPRVLRWECNAKISNTVAFELARDSKPPFVTKLQAESAEKRCEWYKELVRYVQGEDDDEDVDVDEEEEGEEEEETEENDEEGEDADNEEEESGGDEDNGGGEEEEDEEEESGGDEHNEGTEFESPTRVAKKVKEVKKKNKDKIVEIVEALDARVTELGIKFTNEISQFGDQLNRLDRDVKGLKYAVYGEDHADGSQNIWDHPLPDDSEAAVDKKGEVEDAMTVARQLNFIEQVQVPEDNEVIVQNERVQTAEQSEVGKTQETESHDIPVGETQEKERQDGLSGLQQPQPEVGETQAKERQDGLSGLEPPQLEVGKPEEKESEDLLTGLVPPQSEVGKPPEKESEDLLSGLQQPQPEVRESQAKESEDLLTGLVPPQSEMKNDEGAPKLSISLIVDANPLTILSPYKRKRKNADAKEVIELEDTYPKVQGRGKGRGSGRGRGGRGKGKGRGISTDEDADGGIVKAKEKRIKYASKYKKSPYLNPSSNPNKQSADGDRIDKALLEEYTEWMLSAVVKPGLTRPVVGIVLKADYIFFHLVEAPENYVDNMHINAWFYLLRQQHAQNGHPGAWTTTCGDFFGICRKQVTIDDSKTPEWESSVFFTKRINSRPHEAVEGS